MKTESRAVKSAKSEMRRIAGAERRKTVRRLGIGAVGGGVGRALLPNPTYTMPLLGRSVACWARCRGGRLCAASRADIASAPALSPDEPPHLRSDLNRRGNQVADKRTQESLAPDSTTGQPLVQQQPKDGDGCSPPNLEAQQGHGVRGIGQ